MIFKSVKMLKNRHAGKKKDYRCAIWKCEPLVVIHFVFADNPQTWSFVLVGKNLPTPKRCCLFLLWDECTYIHTYISTSTSNRCSRQECIKYALQVRLRRKELARIEHKGDNLRRNNIMKQLFSTAGLVIVGCGAVYTVPFPFIPNTSLLLLLFPVPAQARCVSLCVYIYMYCGGGVNGKGSWGPMTWKLKT